MALDEKTIALPLIPVIKTPLQILWNDSETVTRSIASLAWCSEWIIVHICPSEHKIVLTIQSCLETNHLSFYYKKDWTSLVKQSSDVSFRVGTVDLLESFRSNEQEFLVWSHLELSTHLQLVWGWRKEYKHQDQLVDKDAWKYMKCFDSKSHPVMLTTTSNSICIDQPNLFHFILTRLAVIGSLFRMHISRNNWILFRAVAPEAELRYMLPVVSGEDNRKKKKKSADSSSWISIQYGKETTDEKAIVMDKANNEKNWITVDDSYDKLHFYEQYSTILLEWNNPERWRIHGLSSSDVRQLLSSFSTRILWSFVLQEGLNVSVSAIKLSVNLPDLGKNYSLQHANMIVEDNPITFSSLERLCQSGFEYTAKTAVLNQLIKYYEEKYDFLSTNEPKCNTTLHDNDEMCRLHKPRLPLSHVNKTLFQSLQLILDERTLQKTDDLLEKEFQTVSEFQSYLELIPSWLIIRLERIELIPVYAQLVSCKSIWVLPIDSNSDKTIVYVQRVWVFDKNVDNGNGMTIKDLNYIQQLQLQSPLYVPQIFIIRLPGSKHLRFALGLEESFFMTRLQPETSTKKK